MVEYGNGISHGGAGQVSGGGGGGSTLVNGHGGGPDLGANISNAFNGAVATFSAMPLAEQVLLVAVALILVYFIFRRAF
jgi:hypothetical protein